MLKITESNYFRGVCIVLALSILNLSCQSSYNSTDCNSLQLPLDITDSQDFKNQVHTMLDLATTMQRIDNYTSIKEAYAVLLNDDENSAHMASIMTNEFRQNEELGQSDYLAAKVNSGVISENLKIELEKLTNEMAVLMDSQPTMDTYFNFLESKKNNVSLCAADSKIQNAYIEMVISIVSYYYPIGSEQLQIKLGSELRGCNWWQNILCLSLAILSIPFAFVIGGTAVEALLFGADKVTINENPIGDNGKETLTLVAAIIGAFIAAYHIFNLCCPEDEIPEQKCLEPTGSVLYSTNCDEHRYVIFGPSEYSFTVWDNENTNPSNITTNLPEIRFSVPNPGQQSEIRSNVSCVANQNEIEVFAWASTETVTYDPLPLNFNWAHQPPNNAQLNTEYEVAVTQGTSNNLQLSWSVSPQGGAITSTGSFSGKLKFFITGTKVVKAKLTDICTGNVLVVSKSVIVN